MLRSSLEWQARRRRKDREIGWHPDWIILDAKTHQADEVDPRVNLSKGSRRRIRLVLLALAAEIGLKAWQIREREGEPPDHDHDLVKLFDVLCADT